MDGLSLTPTTSSPFFSTRIHLQPFSLSRITPTRIATFSRKPNAFKVLASKEDDPQLDSYDLMELKFGRLLGEDPKLTLAKIMGRKANPDASYLEIEKSYYKNKGKMVEVKEVPFDGVKEGKSSSSFNDLNLVRPVPRKGIKFQSDDKQVAPKISKPSQPARKMLDVTKGGVPNVILRKPSAFYQDDNEDKPSRLRIKPNLSLKMGDDAQVKEKFNDMTLLRKPEPLSVKDTGEKEAALANGDAKNAEGIKLNTNNENINDKASDLVLLRKSDVVDAKMELENEHQQFGDEEDKHFEESEEISSEDHLEPSTYMMTNDIENMNAPTLVKQNSETIGEEQLEHNFMESSQEQTDSSQPFHAKSVDSRDNTLEAMLKGKPKRLDQSVKKTSASQTEEALLTKSNMDAVELENVVAAAPLEVSEDADWTRAEDLVKTGDRGDVELVSCSTRGFAVSFGSLIGFLPYRNLAVKWKFLAFESWLRRKGLDPSMYRQKLGIIANYDAENTESSFSSVLNADIDSKIERKVSSDMKLEDLFGIYNQEKMKFLSSFIGQKIKVNVILADRKSRKLVFSLRPKEKEEMVEKKRNLMARVQVGDVVKCSIKKITYFGIFVEVEGVPALIHQTEVSWDATLDPASYFKIGQVIEAKVHQLDFALERIFLSLKEVMPDPLMEALESVVGDRDPLVGRLEEAKADTEWVEVDSLIRELQQIDGIQSVSKGHFFLSPGLAPTFQVYMASIYEDQYKLLARSGNKVQEVIVETSLDKEGMKSAIMTCTNRVE